MGCQTVSRANDACIAERLDDSDAKGSCLYVPAGSERRALRRRVASGAVVQPQPGMFVCAARWRQLGVVDRHLHRMRGYLQLRPDAVFCAFSAAAAYGLEVPFGALESLHLLCSRSRGEADSAFVRRYGFKTDGVCDVSGLRLVSVDEAVLECCCLSSFDVGLAIVDSALRAGLFDLEALARYFSVHGKRRKGISCAREVLRFADGASENGGESVVRGRILMAGFTRPELQVEIPDPIRSGTKYRVDYLWRPASGQLVAGELDGKAKYTDRGMTRGASVLDVAMAERQRESRLTALGIKVVRFAYGQTRDQAYLCRLLDAYGVPRADPKDMPRLK